MKFLLSPTWFDLCTEPYEAETALKTAVMKLPVVREWPRVVE